MKNLKVFTAFDGKEFYPIEGFENLYAVSKEGIILSLPRNIWNGHAFVKHEARKINGHKISNGYIQVALYKNHKRNLFLVHRIVAKTFLPNPKHLSQINHIDGDKTNNNLENLEWCTNSENQLHAWSIGLQKKHIAGKPRRKVRLYNEMESLLFSSVADACRYLKQTNNANLHRVLSKKKSYNTIKGYKAEYYYE